MGLASLNLLPAISQPEPQAECLRLQSSPATRPIPLKGRLAVTYVEQSISNGDAHEVGVFDLAAPELGIRRLTHNHINEAEVEISPDGRQLLYTARPKLDDFEHDSEIWLASMTNSEAPVKLLTGEPMGVPAWHYPAGDGFSFIEWGSESGDSQLYALNLSDRRVTPLLPGISGIADPEMSDDGRLISFKRSRPGEHGNQPSIYVANREGSQIRRLTGHDKRVSDHDPVFSRDGTKIYFERYYGPGDWFEASQARGDDPRHNWWGIVEVDVISRQERVVIPYDPSGCHFFWLPTVSPDGEYLMVSHVDIWAEERQPPEPWADLWVVEINGNNLQKVPGTDWFYFFDWTQ